MILLLLACAEEPEPEPTCDTAVVPTWEGWADGFFAGYCRSCHSVASPDRHGAPTSIDLDTYTQAAELAPLIAEVVLEEGTMPIGGGVPDADAELLRIWLDCPR